MGVNDNALRLRLEELRTEIEVVKERRRADEDYLARLRRERDRIDRQLTEPATGKPNNGARDILVVDAGILGDIIYEWASERPENRIVDLSSNAGVHARNIRGFRNREQKTVSLGIAEKLLLEIGREHFLGERLPIIDNPNLAKARIEQKKQEERLEDLTGY